MNAYENYHLFLKEKRGVIVAEVFDTWETSDVTYWAYYFYKVKNVYYYGAASGGINIKNLGEN